jgi:predicted dehydrogenase
VESDRRHFLKTAAIAATAFSQARVWGADDRMRIGAIGTGGRCNYLLRTLNDIGGNEIVAVCDVYEPHRAKARTEHGPQAAEYGDYRKLLEDKSIDAVVIAAPDHWHVPMTIAAVEAGKDVYVEKPVTHSMAEAESLSKAVEASNRVVQTGTQQRSWPHFIQAKKLIDSGALGQITFIETHWYQNHYAHHSNVPDIDTGKLDWKQFLGSAPDQPFDVRRYTDWRFYWDFGGGALTDLFTHWVDVVHWYMNSDTPTSVFAQGSKYVMPERDCPDTLSASYLYGGNFEVVYNGSLIGNLEGGGLTFRGTKGMLKIDRSSYGFYPEGTGYSEDMRLLAPADQARTAGDGGRYHMENFLDCVRSRRTPNAPVPVGIAAARPGHLGNISLREGRLVHLPS